jgi:outer membrane protein assembly factor BamB
MVSDDMVFVGCNDNNFYALDMKDGSLEWVFTCRAGIHSNPIVYGEFVFFGCDDGRVYALEKDNGDVAWQFAPGETIDDDLYSYITTPIISDPVVNDGILYISAGGKVYALNAKTIVPLETPDKEKEELPSETWIFIILTLLLVVVATVIYLIWDRKNAK